MKLNVLMFTRPRSPALTCAWGTEAAEDFSRGRTTAAAGDGGAETRTEAGTRLAR